ncbi:hypothetical protein I547_6250 [Mycobacterium kansasii 824]|uniref:Uncharacterized protein n=1 Tax=Mycobacterium kansasii TaxID=1768 RepID=A0A1V3XF79_MYCKA|nr:hypothetical protein I547_6250 [Mycobacterium kansasii 824]OOK77101.1 hypothetical protein BZL29_3435 [Mycobacterium kansasii]
MLQLRLTVPMLQTAPIPGGDQRKNLLSTPAAPSSVSR